MQQSRTKFIAGAVRHYMSKGLSPQDARLVANKDAAIEFGDTWKGSKVPGMPQVSADVVRKVKKYPYCSRALPRYSAGADHVNDGSKHQGKCIIRSESHEREVMARHNMHKDFSSVAED